MSASQLSVSVELHMEMQTLVGTGLGFEAIVGCGTWSMADGLLQNVRSERPLEEVQQRVVDGASEGDSEGDFIGSAAGTSWGGTEAERGDIEGAGVGVNGEDGDGGAGCENLNKNHRRLAAVVEDVIVDSGGETCGGIDMGGSVEELCKYHGEGDASPLIHERCLSIANASFTCASCVLVSLRSKGDSGVGVA